jgi:hypothetical protein
MSINKRDFQYPALAFLFVLLAFMLSIAVRLETFTQVTGAQGLEATYHVLWTARALEQSSFESHYFLPTVTMNPELGSPFSWGATVETIGGSHVYTSFPPTGFLLPHFLFSWRSGGVGFLILAFFNSLIGLLTAFVMGGLARAVTRWLRGDATVCPRTEWTVFTLVSITYLFLRESLVSHGSVYWPHSLAQLPLILGSWMAFRLLLGHRDIPTILILLLASFIYPSLEWTGFVFGLGVSLALFMDWFIRRRNQIPGTFVGNGSLAVASLALLATTLSGVLLIVHFAIAIGIENLLSALARRASARSFDYGAALEIIPSYVTSFGALVPIAVIATVQMWRKGTLPLPNFRPAYFLIFIVSFPMLESLIMLQHANQFSFDRLKLSVPLIILVTIFFVKMKDRAKPIYILFTLYFVISSNLQIFSHDSLYYKRWGLAVSANNKIVSDFAADTKSDCILLGSPSQVRGYLNLIFDSDIIEFTSVEELLTLVDNNDRFCGTALISTQHEFSDLPTIIRIEVLDEAGNDYRIFDATY